MRGVKKRFGLDLKKWRYRAGISQEERLARGFASHLHRRHRTKGAECIAADYAKLAKALKTSLSKLFGPLGACPPNATNCVETEEQNETT